jgi:hypothetical protein
MNETKGSTQKDFPEWMVTQALAAHLGSKDKPNPAAMEWLFHLDADTPDGSSKLRDLCGFDWTQGGVVGGPEESFKEGDDRGSISPEDFKKIYWTTAPDFRYWTEHRQRQLIVEAKGTPGPIGQRDKRQAERYFSYLRDSGHEGGIVYLVPNPRAWLDWLVPLAKESDSGIPFGVVDLRLKIAPRVSNELVRVVGKTLVQTADLLEAALNFSHAA